MSHKMRVVYPSNGGSWLVGCCVINTPLENKQPSIPDAATTNAGDDEMMSMENLFTSINRIGGGLESNN